MTINTLVISTQSSSTASWTPTAIRNSQIDATNPTYPRIFRLDDQFVTLYRPNPAGAAYICGISLQNLAAALIQIVPELTWQPYFTTHPSSVTKAPSASTSFTIVVNSELSVTYQWQVSTDSGVSWSNVTNTGVYSGATTVTLSISNVNGHGASNYRCQATNSRGTTSSNAATLTIDPNITSQPSGVSVAHGAGATASFTVAATGLSTLSYQWQVSTDSGSTWNNVSNGATYSGVTTVTLNLLAGSLSTTGMNGYEYRCNVTDTNGTYTSNAATLTVT